MWQGFRRSWLVRVAPKSPTVFHRGITVQITYGAFRVLPADTDIPDPGAEAVVTLLNLLRVAFGRMAAQFAKIDRTAAIAALNIIEDHVTEDATCLTALAASPINDDALGLIIDQVRCYHRR
jgi:hypothetical protein